MYGMHRYWLVYNFYKYRENVPGPPPEVKAWPRVTMQLPIFNERYVIERLVEAVSRFDYPRELLDVQVLDDSTDETRANCERVRGAISRRWACRFLICTASNRDRIQGGRAGGRIENFAKGEYVAIFDADFIAVAGFSAPDDSLFSRIRKSGWCRRDGRI